MVGGVIIMGAPSMSSHRSWSGRPAWNARKAGPDVRPGSGLASLTPIDTSADNLSTLPGLGPKSRPGRWSLTKPHRSAPSGRTPAHNGRTCRSLLFQIRASTTPDPQTDRRHGATYDTIARTKRIKDMTGT